MTARRGARGDGRRRDDRPGRRRWRCGIAAVSGARRAELAALRWTDVRDGMLTIDSAIEVVEPRRRHAGAARRRDEDRQHAHASPSTPTPSTLIDTAARRARAVRPVDVRPRPRARQPRPHRLVVEASPHARPASTPQWRLHDLRHWSATVAIGQGHDVRTVAGRLGHANPAMTLRVYAHAFAAADQAVAAGLGVAPFRC